VGLCESRRAVALELLAVEPVVARSGVEAARGDLGVERRPGEHAVGAGLVWRLVGGEAQCAVLAEDAELAAEALLQLLEQRGQRATHVAVVDGSRRREVGLPV